MNSSTVSKPTKAPALPGVTSKAGIILENILKMSKVRYEKEYRFYPSRRWRADYYLPDWKALIEIEGAIWTGGGHTRGGGYSKDCEKYNFASALGFTLLRFPANEITKTKGQNIIDMLCFFMKKC